MNCTLYEIDDILPGGIPVAKGDMVSYCPYTIHRQPDIWPDPEAFDPDRFAHSPAPYTFIPFHGGPRQCLGMDMAYLEAKVMLCTLLQSLQVRLVPGFVVQPKAALILTAKNGVQVHLRPRHSSTRS
jgi:cytochrome P450